MDIYKRYAKAKEQFIKEQAGILDKEMNEIFKKMQEINPDYTEFIYGNSTWIIKSKKLPNVSPQGKKVADWNILKDLAQEWVFGGDTDICLTKITNSYITAYIKNALNGAELSGDETELEVLESVESMARLKEMAQLFVEMELRVTLWWDMK